MIRHYFLLLLEGEVPSILHLTIFLLRCPPCCLIQLIAYIYNQQRAPRVQHLLTSMRFNLPLLLQVPVESRLSRVCTKCTVEFFPSIRLIPKHLAFNASLKKMLKLWWILDVFQKKLIVCVTTHWAGGWSNPTLSDNRHWAVPTVLLSPNFGLLHPPAQCVVTQTLNFVEKHLKFIKVLATF